MKEERWGWKLARAMDLPVEIGQACRITILGQDKVWVENHLGILEYSDKRVRFARSKGEISIIGTHLFLEQSNAGSALVTGCIQVLAYSGSVAQDV